MSFFCNIVMFLKNKMKQIKILFFVFLAPGTSKALNLFEMFMIKMALLLFIINIMINPRLRKLSFRKKNKVLSNY